MKKNLHSLFQFILVLPILLFAEDSPLAPSIENFASHFYKEAFSTSDRNEVFSPLCLFHGISMAYLGADGKTKQELDRALHLTLSQEDLPLEFSSLVYMLHPDTSTKNQSLEINIASSVWIDPSCHILPSYKASLEEDFKSQIDSLDVHNPESSALTINSWISKQTKNTINKLLRPQDISKDMQLMLISALYFKGSWAKPFSSHSTKKDLFHIDEDTSHEVPMMNQLGSFPYYEDENMQLLLLPFLGNTNGGGRMAAFILLPKESLETLEDALPEMSLSSYFSQTEPTYVHVSLPKFTFEQKYDFIPILSRLGVHSAFSSHANFSKITGNNNLHINKGIHKAFFSLDEAGVTASAATAIGVGYSCAKTPLPHPTYFHANHPFIFGIVDVKSNVVLFLGKIVDP